MSGSGVVQAPRVVLPGGVRPAAIHFENGIITAITDPVGADDSGPMIFPGLVDTHVHVNEPGRTEWEGFATATRAAVAGGTTAICDMPLNSIPPTTSVAALNAKQAAAVGSVFCDVGFWGGIVGADPQPLLELEDAGVVGFKAFLIDSGVAEFPAVSVEDLETACRGLRFPVIVHAESAQPMEAAGAAFEALDPRERREYSAYLASRPEAGEHDAIAQLIDLARRTRLAVHVVHLSASSALPLLAAARDAGVSITVETCPHYLALAAEDIPEGATEYKCAPPIREGAHRERLWDGLGHETIDMVVSDHSPAPAELKARDSGDFGAAWGGISSLQLRLPVVWTEAQRRGIPAPRLASWLAAEPARLAGLAHKGRIEVGNDADLVVWDPDAQWKVDPGRLEHRHPVSPYTDRVLRGRVVRTILRGMDIYADGEIADPPRGKLLIRS